MAELSEPTLHVGAELPAHRHVVEQEVIDAWASLSGDHNPLHVDSAYAATTRFGTTIAHGHLSLTWLCEAVLAWRGLDWVSGGELSDVRFVGPVRAGATIRVEGAVVEISAENDTAICDLRIVDEADNAVCVVAKAVLPITSSGGSTR